MLSCPYFRSDCLLWRDLQLWCHNSIYWLFAWNSSFKILIEGEFFFFFLQYCCNLPPAGLEATTFHTQSKRSRHRSKSLGVKPESLTVLFFTTLWMMGTERNKSVSFFIYFFFLWKKVIIKKFIFFDQIFHLP